MSSSSASETVVLLALVTIACDTGRDRVAAYLIARERTAYSALLDSRR